MYTSRFLTSLIVIVCLALIPLKVVAQQIRKGSKIVVVASSTKLMRGSHVLANVSRGYRTNVTDIHGNWIGVDIDGKRGWLLRQDLALAADRNSAATRRPMPVRSSSEPAHSSAASSRMSVNRKAARKTLDETEETLWPVIDTYCEAFQAAAKPLAEQRQNDSTKIENLRAQVSRLRQAGQIDKNLVQQVEPHLKRLESLLLVDRSSVLSNSPNLQLQREVVINKMQDWHQAIRNWSQTASMPHQTLPVVPSAEQFIQWQEQLATQLVLTMSDDARTALLANRHAASRLDVEEARSIHQLNQLRILVGVRPLKIDSALVATGRDHSYDMRSRNFFSHHSPVDGKHTPRDRGNRFGTVAWGENIAWGSRDAAETMDMWFHSPGHLANMINADYQRVGLGRSKNHWTQMFGP